MDPKSDKPQDQKVSLKKSPPKTCTKKIQKPNKNNSHVTAFYNT